MLVAVRHVTDSAVGQVILPMLDEGARAHRHRAGLYVEPHDGLLGLVNSRRHHFIVGRRGVGKSTLLAQVGRPDLTLKGSPTVYVDLETVPTRDYGSTVLGVLLVILSELRKEMDRVGPDIPGPEGAERLTTDRSSPDFKSPKVSRRSVKRLRAKAARAVDSLVLTLRAIHDGPGSVEKEIVVERTTGKGSGGKVSLRSRAPLGLATADGTIVRGSSENKAEKTLGRQQTDRAQALSELIPQIRDTLEAAVSLVGESLFLLLDDFHHVPSHQQPLVLSMLHQIVKNQDIYLKIGGVRHRLYPYVEGDPPSGLQIGHDAGEIDLDLNLERFSHVQYFLEQVLQHTIRYSDVRVDDLLSDGARRRLTLASGAVARDYLYLLSIALRHANERLGTEARPHNYVVTEDIDETCQGLTELKYMDLESDSGPRAQALRTTFAQVATFCLDDNRTNAFLVDAGSLLASEWGRDVAMLSDLRFVHRVGRVTVPAFRGRQFVAFLIDLSSYVGLSQGDIEEVKIWDPEDRERLSRQSLVFSG